MRTMTVLVLVALNDISKVVAWLLTLTFKRIMTYVYSFICLKPTDKLKFMTSNLHALCMFLVDFCSTKLVFIYFIFHCHGWIALKIKLYMSFAQVQYETR